MPPPPPPRCPVVHGVCISGTERHGHQHQFLGAMLYATVAPGSRSVSVFRFPTPICIVIPSQSFLKVCAFEWGQSSGPWEVAALNRGSSPTVSSAPSQGDVQITQCMPRAVQSWSHIVLCCLAWIWGYACRVRAKLNANQSKLHGNQSKLRGNQSTLQGRVTDEFAS